MKNIAILLSLFLIASCSYRNLSKKSDKTCLECYGYILKNCPSIANKQIDTVNFTVTVFGQSLKSEGNISSICDSLWKYRNIPLVGDSDLTLIDKKENGLNQVFKVNKKTGKFTSKCDSDTVYIQKTIYITKDCLITNKEVKLYLKAKLNYFYIQYKRYINFLLLLLLISIFLYVKSKFNK